MRTLHACKDFSDDSKDKSRFKSVIEPIKKHFGKLPDDRIILSTAGLYSRDKTRLEIYQYLRAGIIRFHKQFLGVDNGMCNSKGQIDLITENKRRYGEHTKYYVPFEQGDIAATCYKHGEKIGFINLDLQNGIPLAFPIFIRVLKYMQNFNGFGISFNSMLSTGYNTYLNHFETVREGMERLFNENLEERSFLDSSVTDLIKQYRLVAMDAYDGTGLSSTVMGTYIFIKE